MKLLKCRNCGHYSRNAWATVSFRAHVKLEKNGLYSLDEEDGLYDRSVDSAIELTCIECDKQETEEVEVDQCPHIWQTSGYGYRRCSLCGQKQEGKLVFE